MEVQKTTMLAFDLGASSGRVIIGQYQLARDGKPHLDVFEIHRFPNQAIQVGSHYHWDTLRLLQEMKIGFQKAFQAGYHPVSFGVDTWGVDFGLLDRNGELLGFPYHYRDPHTEGLITEINELVGEEALFAQSGLQCMPFNTIYQLYAMRKANSPKLDMAETLLLTPDLLVYLLTGRKNCEFTMATTTQLFQPSNQEWNEDLMDRLGIPRRLFLDPIQPGTRLGPLSAEVCVELGIPPVEAIAVGTHDTESAVAAIPAEDEPFVYLVCGTWSLLGTELQEPLLTRKTMELKFSNEGGVGGTYQLLKNIMGLWILQECKREWDEAGEDCSFTELVAEASKAEPFRSFIHPDDDQFFAPNGMPDKIRAYCRDTGQLIPSTKGEFVRCILESLALCYRQAVEQVEQLTGIKYEGLHMVGGGIQNELLCQYAASSIGRPVWAGPVEASAIGNLLAQLIATGHCSSLAEARQLVKRSFPIKTYQPENQSAWNESYNVYKRIRRSG